MNISELIIAILSSGFLSGLATYIITFKSQKKLAEAQAEEKMIEVEHHKLDLSLDSFDYMKAQCDKYMKDYFAIADELAAALRKVALRCDEIATLKTRITYLEGFVCYKTDCPHRLKTKLDAYRETSKLGLK